MGELLTTLPTISWATHRKLQRRRHDRRELQLQAESLHLCKLGSTDGAYHRWRTWTDLVGRLCAVDIGGGLLPLSGHLCTSFMIASVGDTLLRFERAVERLRTTDRRYRRQIDALPIPFVYEVDGMHTADGSELVKATVSGWRVGRAATRR
ncbi:hypothetical protein THAOC_23748 [Thalassiosira oceanica]|uniref:Uncharacterized protein n=1 Tax=Thalassiosira oceanica TaxID=159749 RepID=K0SCD6_THAOC|nr:hypothetical protein THAOC_23748 [Thalassiosira oceanica]|eukprot:EJK56377.1 hypothetical protein THAOC_23748 [Thalassiosira oceanica]